ncbi:MAG: sulfatase [Algisphaera sp.]
MNRPPNILLLVSEDVGRHQGCYGDAFARTPNIDRLAQEGCRFTNAYAPSPVCAPSRSAMVTGQDPRKLGTHLMRSVLSDPPRLVMHELRDAGYFVNWSNKTDFNLSDLFYIADAGTPTSCADAASDWREDLAAGTLPDQPWLLYRNFDNTHESGMWPPDSTAETRAQEPRRDDPSLDHLPGLVVPPYLPDTRTTRASLVRYYDNLEEQDRQIGKVLDDLQKSDYADNTVVIYLSDHGRGLVREKRWCYPAGVQVPLIVRAPDALKLTTPGSVRDDLVSWVDLAPTLHALAGIDTAPRYDGRPFLGSSAANTSPNHVFFGRDRMDESQDCVRGATNGRYLYLRNDRPDVPYAQLNIYMETSPVTTEVRQLHQAGKLPFPANLWMAPTKPAEELYDLSADPHAVHNLADRSDHQTVLKTMRQAVSQWCDRVNDQGAIPENTHIQNGLITDQRDFLHGRAGTVPTDLDPNQIYATQYEPHRV